MPAPTKHCNSPFKSITDENLMDGFLSKLLVDEPPETFKLILDDYHNYLNIKTNVDHLPEKQAKEEALQWVRERIRRSYAERLKELIKQGLKSEGIEIEEPPELEEYIRLRNEGIPPNKAAKRVGWDLTAKPAADRAGAGRGTMEPAGGAVFRRRAWR